VRIKKVINNSIVCALDDRGSELIVTGKGIGFQRHPGDEIAPASVERTYRMEKQSEQRKLLELVEQIPLEHLAVTEQLIAVFQKRIPHVLNESLLITLADHISFAIKRKAEGMEFTNPLKDAIMCYYPKEYKMGEYSLDVIEQKLQVRLHPDEAAFIALHIVNAELNSTMSETYEITRIIEGCIAVVEQFYQKAFDRTSLSFSRFVVHLRYFAQRLLQGGTLQDTQEEQDAEFRQMVFQSYQRHFQCAQRIADFIRAAYHKELSEEEQVYLTIHLKRINLDSTN
jgi:beta-glucoside operon transcriptional antiterminator